MTIITGASRGLGAAIAGQLLQRHAVLLTISRHPDETLDARASNAGVTLEQWAADLADAVSASARLEAWLHRQQNSFSSATLINNAALAGKAGPIADSDPPALAAVVRVGLEAPMLLTRAFLHATRTWHVPRKVLNISSGAGKKPLTGAAAYCAVKAGIDQFSRVVALDEANGPNAAMIVSLAPGVIDTDMQTELRESDRRGFPDQPRFAEMKVRGQLMSAGDAATRVLAFLGRQDFGTHPIADVREV
ncbi:MAG: SDR family NAD(P)-dependent oxidoreductase [Burkholderiaceae bacterium]